MRRPGTIAIIAGAALLGPSPAWTQVRNPVDNFIDMRAPEGRPDRSPKDRAWNNFRDNCDRASSPDRSNCTVVATPPPPLPPPVLCAPYVYPYVYPYFYGVPPIYRGPYYGYCWY